MFSIEQSPFLQALGHAIGHSLWQVAALWLLYTIISSVGRLNANKKYQLAAAASLTGLAWFLVTLVRIYATTSPSGQPGSIYTGTAVEAGSSLPYYLLFIYHSVARSAKSLAPYISCGYLLMFVLLSIRLSNSFRQLRFISTQGLGEVSPQLQAFVVQNAAQSGIARRVNLFTSQYVEGPLTMGFWKPIILMPVACLNQLSTTEVEAILLHELAHIRRHDYLVNIFLQVSEISLFFNPFMRLLLKQAKQERENNCDDYVLQFGYSPRDYAKALLAIEHGSNMQLLALAAKGNQSFQLLNRVKRMVAPQPQAFNYRQQLGMLLLFTILMLGFTIIVPGPKKAVNKSVGQTVKKINAHLKTVRALPAENLAALSVPSPAPSFDMVEGITNYQSEIEHSINLKEIEKAGRDMELQSKDFEAIGEQMGQQMAERMEPLTKKLTAMASNLSHLDEADFTEEYAKALAGLDEIKALPVEKLTEISKTFQKKLMLKLSPLFKVMPSLSVLPLNSNKAFTRLWRQTNNTDIALAKEKLAIGRADFARQQAAKNNVAFSEVQNKLNEQINGYANAQQDAMKQYKAMAKMERLNLGLLTDDRDTLKAEAEGLLAKLQARRNSAYNLHFKNNNNTFYIPEDIRINSKYPGKCVITVTDKNVKINSDEDGINEPASLNINGQNIDIRHEKQVNNGKEENVVIISITGSK